MNKLVCGLAASLLMSASAFAQPTPLSNADMDKVSAGFFELDNSNTSTVAISIWRRTSLGAPTPNTLQCSGCYLLIVTPTFSIGATFGPATTAPVGPPE